MSDPQADRSERAQWLATWTDTLLKELRMVGRVHAYSYAFGGLAETLESLNGVDDPAELRAGIERAHAILEAFVAADATHQAGQAPARPSATAL